MATVAASTSNPGSILSPPYFHHEGISRAHTFLGCARGAILACSAAARASAFIEIVFIPSDSNTREQGVLFQINSGCALHCAPRAVRYTGITRAMSTSGGAQRSARPARAIRGTDFASSPVAIRALHCERVRQVAHLAHPTLPQQHLHDVEAQLDLRVLQQTQVIEGGPGKPAASLRVDRRGRPCPLFGGAGFDLNEDQAICSISHKECWRCNLHIRRLWNKLERLASLHHFRCRFKQKG
jgi:hypothetical protein